VVTGCLNNDPPPKVDEHPPIAQPEIDRGLMLCQSYVVRVCGCAEKDPSLKEECGLAKGQPSAVQMHLDVLHGAPLADFGPDGKLTDGGVAGKRPPLNDSERRLTEASLRKVIAACVAADAQLPSTCPRHP
jgi:hypothetical protein